MTISVYPATDVDSLIAALAVRVTALESAPPTIVGEGLKIRVLSSRNLSSTDLFRSYNEMTGFRTRFAVNKAGVVIPFLNVNLVHRNLVNGPIGYGVRIATRFAEIESDLPDVAWSIVPCGIASANIASVEDHYGQATAFAPVPVAPGWHEISIWGNSHSSAAPMTDGLAEVNWTSGNATDYNILMLLLMEGASVG